MPDDFDTPNPGWTYDGDIYGGGALGAVEGKTNVVIKGGNITGNIFGAGEGESGHPNKAKVHGSDNTVTVNVEGGSIGKDVYGGGNLAVAEVDPIITIRGGAVTENIYGGGYGAPAVLTGSPTIYVTGGTISQDVYGGGALANVVGSTNVNIDGGTVSQDVYGGGALANVSANTSVNLNGGSLRNSYGGGLGSAEVAAIVEGNATTTLEGAIVLGNVFGCNNLNGTPQGHAKVHVLNTTPRDGQGDDEYDVAAVYGGGNLAAYEPTNDDDFAEVLIENCDNSIEYVYGGGNAAPVPATRVTIKGANAIDNAFAGGNGAGYDNPGADIGYKGFFSRGTATKYGTGVATINIQGGTIHHVYGGSNTLGHIKDHAEVNVDAEGSCTMAVAELYGGGKSAPGKAATLNIACTGEGKIDNVYGGAHMADMSGDIELNIRGGNIGNAFGGNNESGTIAGSITVNVDWNNESPCAKSLGNVFGGGNLAQYAIPEGKTLAVNIKNGTVSQNVYGGGKGKADDHARGKVTGDPVVTIGVADVGRLAVVNGDVYGGGDAGNVEGTPVVNVINKCNTQIANVYGGGNAADVNGTDVNIDGGNISGMVFGGGHGDKDSAPQKQADVYGAVSVEITGGTINKVFAGSNSKGDIFGAMSVYINKANTSCDMHIEEVYGGGNEAAGKAGTVTIGCTGKETEGITNVYGGANAADISTDISLTIRGGRINNVFGGNNADGVISGNVTVNIKGGQIENVFGENNAGGNVRGNVTVNINMEPTDACGNKSSIGYVYGGGNDASYSPTNTNGAYPEVNLIKGVVKHDVFGGGLGKDATVTSNPTVTMKPDSKAGFWVLGDIYGGGSAAPVVGSTKLTVNNGTIGTLGSSTPSGGGCVYGGGLGATADVSGNTQVQVTGNTDVEKNVYGGGNGGVVQGNTKVVIGGTVTE